MAKFNITGTKKLTNFRWLNFYQVDFVHEDGSKGNWLYVSRHEPGTKVDAVAVVPVVSTPEGNKLLLVKEFRLPIQNYEIHFPVGLIDPGENIVKAASRELKEETGYNIVTVTRISPPLITSAGLTDENLVTVFADCEPDGPQELEKFEDIELILLDLEGIREIMRNLPYPIDGKCWHTLLMYDQLGVIK